LTLQVTRLCDLSNEADSVTSVSWNERVCHAMFCPVSSSVTFRTVCRLNIKDRTIVYNGFL